MSSGGRHPAGEMVGAAGSEDVSSGGVNFMKREVFLPAIVLMCM